MRESSWPPEPESAGHLRPPPRLPPTAVGLLTPPPPGGSGARPGRRLSPAHVAVLAAMGGLFVAAGPVVAMSVEPVIGMILGGGSVLVGGSVWYRLARR
jgi:hypothetical protein